MIERMRALEHPAWPDKNDDIESLKSAITRCASELDHLKFRHEARGAELGKLKARYADLERLYKMRPDAMRRAGEMEITELVRGKQELAEQELALQKAKTDAEQQRSAQARADKARLEERSAELEREYTEKKKKLEEAERETAHRRSELTGSETRLQEQLEATRRAAVEETVAGFKQEMAARERVFLQEKAVLNSEAEGWRRKAEEAFSQLVEAREALLQKNRQAKLDVDDCRERSAELDKQLADLEKRGARLSEREEACRRLGEEAKKTAQDLKDRSAALENDYAEKKKELEAVKARMRAEIDALVKQYRGK